VQQPAAAVHAPLPLFLLPLTLPLLPLAVTLPLLPLVVTLLLTVIGVPDVAVPIYGHLDRQYFASFGARTARLLSAPAEWVAAEQATFQAKLWGAIQAAADAILPSAVPQHAGARGLANFKSIVTNHAPAASEHARRAVLVKRRPVSETKSRPRIAAKDWLPAHAEADHVPAQGGSVAEQVEAMAEWADYITSTSNPVLYLWRYSSLMQPWPPTAAVGGATPSSKRRKVEGSVDVGAGAAGGAV
jgi:hypothetical protein